jgi:hypothetical protein
MRTAVAALLSFLIASTALAAAPSQAGEPLAWIPVQPAATDAAWLATVGGDGTWPDAPMPTVRQPHPLPSGHRAKRPSEAPQPSIRPSTGRSSGSHRTSGIASWYCRPGISRCTAGYPADCLCAAAGPALRVGDWRGRLVTVRASNGRTVPVRLVDCNCGSHANLIDLYAGAFERLAPLSRGRIAVTVSW